MSTGESPDWLTEHPRSALVAVVVERGDRPDRCTLYPHGASEAEQERRWLSATGDAFVALSDAC